MEEFDNITIIPTTIKMFNGTKYIYSGKYPYINQFKHDLSRIFSNYNIDCKFEYDARDIIVWTHRK